MEVLEAYQAVLDGVRRMRGLEATHGLAVPPIVTMAIGDLLPPVVAWMGDRPASDRNAMIVAVTAAAAVATAVSILSATDDHSKRRQIAEVAQRRFGELLQAHLSIAGLAFAQPDDLMPTRRRLS